MATAQPAGKAYRIGLLSATAQAPGIAPFRQGLRDLGYVEGQSIVILTHRGRIADLAVKNRLPSVSALSEYAEAGGLIAYGPNWLEPGTRAAAQVDKILEGAKPADLTCPWNRRRSTG